MATSEIYFPTSINPPTTPYDNFKPEETVLRSPAEAGYTISRRKFTRARLLGMKFKWQYMNDAEYETFMNFYKNTTKNGSLPFNFSFSTLTLTKSYVVMFASPPETSYAGIGCWEVECIFDEL